MRKGRDGEKKNGKNGGEKGEKTDDYSGRYVIASSRPPKRRPLECRTLVPKKEIDVKGDISEIYKESIKQETIQTRLKITLYRKRKLKTKHLLARSMCTLFNVLQETFYTFNIIFHGAYL